jgi:hypothetical protein
MKQQKETFNQPKRKTMARKQTANTIIDTTKEVHLPKSNGLKIRIDDLRAFEPLTENQKLFFEAYKRGDYFIGLFGSPGVGDRKSVV